MVRRSWSGACAGWVNSGVVNNEMLEKRWGVIEAIVRPATGLRVFGQGCQGKAGATGATAKIPGWIRDAGNFCEKRLGWKEVRAAFAEVGLGREQNGAQVRRRGEL